MKYLLLVLATLPTTAFWAQEEFPDIKDHIVLNSKPKYRWLDFVLVDSTHNDRLASDEAVYHFDMFNLLPGDSNEIVHFSVDSTDYWLPLYEGRLSVTTTPGNHTFQIYVNDNYLEAISPSLRISAQTELIYEVILSKRPVYQGVVTYKPVIYLYPEEEKEVTVDLEIHDGKHPFYYPSYKDAWKCTAAPNGDLTIDGEQYRYLFWEAQQDDHLKTTDVDAGFVVAGSDAISFLEDKLRKVGFTTAERADFITFWGPIIAKNNLNLIRFEWNQTCDKFADLNVSPQPDHLYRFYIFVAPLHHSISIPQQEIPTMDRSGFVVLEWGGQLSNYQPKTSL